MTADPFGRTLALLREPLERDVATLSPLESDGTIWRFKLAVDQAWNTLKDFMVQEGCMFDTVTPRAVIKAAFAARILSDDQVWIDMLDHRELLSRQYDESLLEQALHAIRDRYIVGLNDLHSRLPQHGSTE